MAGFARSPRPLVIELDLIHVRRGFRYFFPDFFIQHTVVEFRLELNDCRPGFFCPHRLKSDEHGQSLKIVSIKDFALFYFRVFWNI